MAKLVDLLAKHLKEWTDGHKIIVQDKDKQCKPCGCLRAELEDGAVWIRDTPLGFNFYLDELASDWCTAKVTYKQWLSARDRLHAETLKDMREPTNADTDQALWDKVAVAALAKSIGTYPDDSTSEQVRYCFEYADAFMAERAKRLKGGV